MFVFETVSTWAIIIDGPDAGTDVDVNAAESAEVDDDMAGGADVDDVEADMGADVDGGAGKGGAGGIGAGNVVMSATKSQ